MNEEFNFLISILPNFDEYEASPDIVRETMAATFAKKAFIYNKEVNHSEWKLALKCYICRDRNGSTTKDDDTNDSEDAQDISPSSSESNDRNGEEKHFIFGLLTRGDEIGLLYGPVYLSRDGEYKYGLTFINSAILEVFRRVIKKLPASYLAFANRYQPVYVPYTKSSKYTTFAEENSLYYICLIYSFDQSKHVPPITLDLYNLFFGTIPSDEWKYVMRKLESVSWNKTSVKIVPLTEGDKNHSDLSSKVSREIYIMLEIQSLVINFICFNIPAFKNWFYIKNYDYDNTILKEQLENRSRAEDMKDKLLELCAESQGLGVDKYLQSSVEYLERNKIYSSESIALEISAEGIALPGVINDSDFSQDKIISGLFLIIYNLFCLNSRIGIVHADLHINNVCGSAEVPGDEGYIIIKIYGKDYFIMNVDMNIVDFGRGILSYEKINALGDKEAEAVLIKQTNDTIRNSYSLFLPEFYADNKAHITYCMREHPDLLFKLFTAMDMFRFSSGLLNIIVNSHIKDTLEAIKKSCYLTLTKLVLDIGSSYIKVDDIPYPNYSLLETIFSDTSYSRDKKVVCILNYDNKIENTIYDLHVAFKLGGPLGYYLKTYDSSDDTRDKMA